MSYKVVPVNNDPTMNTSPGNDIFVPREQPMLIRTNLAKHEVSLQKTPFNALNGNAEPMIICTTKSNGNLVAYKSRLHPLVYFDLSKNPVIRKFTSLELDLQHNTDIQAIRYCKKTFSFFILTQDFDNSVILKIKNMRNMPRAKSKSPRSESNHIDFEIDHFKFDPNSTSIPSHSQLKINLVDNFFIMDPVKNKLGIFNPETSQILVIEVQKTEKSGFCGCSKTIETWLATCQSIQLDTVNAGDKNHKFNPENFIYMEKTGHVLLMDQLGRIASFDINVQQSIGAVNNINKAMEQDMRKLKVQFEVQNILLTANKHKPQTKMDVIAIVNNWPESEENLAENEIEYHFPWVYHWILDSQNQLEFKSKVMLDHFNASGRITASCIFDYKIVTPSIEDTVKTIFLYEGLSNSKEEVSRLWALYNDSARDKYKLCDSPYENISRDSEICRSLGFKPDNYGTGDLYALTKKELICVRIYTEGEDRNLDITLAHSQFDISRNISRNVSVLSNGGGNNAGHRNSNFASPEMQHNNIILQNINEEDTNQLMMLEQTNSQPIQEGGSSKFANRNKNSGFEPSNMSSAKKRVRKIKGGEGKWKSSTVVMNPRKFSRSKLKTMETSKKTLGANSMKSLNVKKRAGTQIMNKSPLKFKGKKKKILKLRHDDNSGSESESRQEEDLQQSSQLESPFKKKNKSKAVKVDKKKSKKKAKKKKKNRSSSEEEDSYLSDQEKPSDYEKSESEEDVDEDIVSLKSVRSFKEDEKKSKFKSKKEESSILDLASSIKDSKLSENSQNSSNSDSESGSEGEENSNSNSSSKESSEEESTSQVSKTESTNKQGTTTEPISNPIEVSDSSDSEVDEIEQSVSKKSESQSSEESSDEEESQNTKTEVDEASWVKSDFESASSSFEEGSQSVSRDSGI